MNTVKIIKSQKNLLLRLPQIGESKKVAVAPKDLSQNYKDYIDSNIEKLGIKRALAFDKDFGRLRSL